MAVEAGFADAVDPGQKRRKNVAGAVRSRLLDLGRAARRGGDAGARRGGRRSSLPARVPLFPRRTQQRGGSGDRHRRSRDRMFVGAGKDRDAAILLDPHRHFRADQIEAFGAHVAAQQAHSGDAHFGFRRTRHHRAVSIADDDVANAHGGAAILGALDLGAADFDVTAVAEILLDGGHQPRRHHVELNGSAGEPPQQREATEYRARAEDAGPDPRRGGSGVRSWLKTVEVAITVRRYRRGGRCQSRQDASGGARERPTSIAEASRAACPGWSCPSGVPSSVVLAERPGGPTRRCSERSFKAPAL